MKKDYQKEIVYKWVQLNICNPDNPTDDLGLIAEDVFDELNTAKIDYDVEKVNQLINLAVKQYTDVIIKCNKIDDKTLRVDIL